jgi:dipeptidyl aminopeptidase/acylaminoacyl peptidase
VQAAAGKVSLSEVCSDGSSVYWLESRPLEGGRVVFVRCDLDAERPGVVDLLPAGVSVRSRVHEYGGGACCLLPGYGPGAFASVDLADQRVWLQPGAGGPPRPLSGEPAGGERWAHGGLGASADGAWVVGVREVHVVADGPPRRCVVALGTGADNVGESVLVEGHDFYGAPRLDPEGRRLATVVWDHPDMPWDRSSVVVTPVGTLLDPATGAPRLVATGPPWLAEGGDEVSVGQPAWRHDGALRFVSDRHGWWQPHCHSGLPDGPPAAALTRAAAEFHGADWALGQSTMAELPGGLLVARMTSNGRDSLVAIVDPERPPQPVPQHCVAISALCGHGDRVVYIGAPPDGPVNVWALTVPRAARPAPRRAALPAALAMPPRPIDLRPIALRPIARAALGAEDVSLGEPFSFVGRSGRQVHGLAYRPALRGTEGPPAALPPLVVGCHAGPTGSVSAGYDAMVQFFTSRGFAFASVDYAGSTGYGRDYRCSLRGLWGVADSEDCLDAARALAAQGRVDATRMAVRGASAGGLTALNALASGEGFAAAVSWYGVTDLLGLAATTHDFEAHYTDRLIGPLPACRRLYEARSPARRAAEMDGSVLLLQGVEDRVVPPAQAEALRDALVAEGRHCEVRFFTGEGHGFRRAETLEAALEAELDFYRRVLGV